MSCHILATQHIILVQYPIRRMGVTGATRQLGYNTSQQPVTAPVPPSLRSQYVGGVRRGRSRSCIVAIYISLRETSESLQEVTETGDSGLEISKYIGDRDKIRNQDRIKSIQQ